MFGTNLTNSFCGSPEYMAPEIVNGLGYSYSVDFYTIGALLHEFTTGLPPFYDSDPEKILKNVLKDDLKFSSKMNPRIIALLSGLLEKNPKKRTNTFDKIKKSDWLRDIKWDDFIHKKKQAPISITLEGSNVHPDFRSIELPVNISESFVPKVSQFYFVQPSSAKDFDTKISTGKIVKTEVSKTESSKVKKKSFDQKMFDDLLARYKHTTISKIPKASEKISLTRNKSPEHRIKDNSSLSDNSSFIETKVESKGINMDKIKRAFSPKRPEEPKYHRNYDSQKTLQSAKNTSNFMSNTTLRVYNSNFNKTEEFRSTRGDKGRVEIKNNKAAFFESKIRSSIEQLKSIQTTNERYKKPLQIDTQYDHIVNRLASPLKTETNKDNRRSHQHIQSASFLETKGKDPSRFFNHSKKENFFVDRIIPSSAKAATRNYPRNDFNNSIAGSFIGGIQERENSSKRFFEMNNLTSPKQSIEQYKSGVFRSFKENEYGSTGSNSKKFNFTSDLKAKPSKNQSSNYLNSRNNNPQSRMNMMHHPMSSKNLQYNRRMFM